MKKRIVALILTVVTTLLLFTSCGNFNFAKEDLGKYASFNYDSFKDAIKNIKIKDGDFTANPVERDKIIKDRIYNAVADKMISAAGDDEKLKAGTIGDGNALYFVYYAKDANGNVYFSADMQENAITGTNKANHVIKLGDVDEDNKFMSLLAEKLDKTVDIKDYIYSALFADEIKNTATKEFEENWKAEESTPETTDGETEADKESAEDEKKKALEAYIAEALTVKNGDIIVVSYTRTYKDAEGKDITETATYETLGLGANASLYAKLFEEGVTAKVGEKVKVSAPTADKPDATSEEFAVVDGDKTYTYKNVTIKYQIENFKPLVEFNYTPYEKVEDDSKKVQLTPDNGHVDGEKQTLSGVELTYYVFPLYTINIPTYENVTAKDILTHVYGTSLKDTTFKVFSDEAYKNGETKLADLVADVAKVNATDIAANEAFFTKYPELKTAVENYNKSTSNSTYKTELEKQRKLVLADLIDKILASTNGTDKVADLIKDAYYDSLYDAAASSYEKDINDKVQKAVWDIINEQVKLNGEYPKKLLKDFEKHILDAHEETYYTGKAGAIAHVDAYKTFEDYLMQNVYKVSSMDAVDAAVTAEAKALIDPMIKIYVVAKACESDAKNVISSYIDKDVEGGKYNTSATEKNQESIDYDRTLGEKFLVDKAYLKAYKKAVGKSNYKYYIETYGETNLSVAHQFDKLFYYLTSYDITYDADNNTTNAVIVDGYIQYRTVKYTVE